MKQPSPWISVVIGVLGLLAGGGWVQYYLSVRGEAERENQRLVSEYLHPMRVYIRDNEGIYKELHERHVEEPWGILESYVLKARREGVTKHSLMKARIDSVADNNSKIIGLLDGYAGYVIEPAFKVQTDRFRSHAIRWNDRWKAVPQVIETEQQLPRAEPFPDELLQALDSEISQRVRGS